MASSNLKYLLMLETWLSVASEQLARSGQTLAVMLKKSQSALWNETAQGCEILGQPIAHVYAEIHSYHQMSTWRRLLSRQTRSSMQQKESALAYQQIAATLAGQTTTVPLMPQLPAITFPVAQVASWLNTLLAYYSEDPVADNTLPTPAQVVVALNFAWAKAQALAMLARYSGSINLTSGKILGCTVEGPDGVRAQVKHYQDATRSKRLWWQMRGGINELVKLLSVYDICKKLLPAAAVAKLKAQGTACLTRLENLPLTTELRTPVKLANMALRQRYHELSDFVLDLSLKYPAGAGLPADALSSLSREYRQQQTRVSEWEKTRRHMQRLSILKHEADQPALFIEKALVEIRQCGNESLEALEMRQFALALSKQVANEVANLLKKYQDILTCTPALSDVATARLARAHRYQCARLTAWERMQLHLNAPIELYFDDPVASARLVIAANGGPLAAEVGENLYRLSRSAAGNWQLVHSDKQGAQPKVLSLENYPALLALLATLPRTGWCPLSVQQRYQIASMILGKRHDVIQPAVELSSLDADAYARTVYLEALSVFADYLITMKEGLQYVTHTLIPACAQEDTSEWLKEVENHPELEEMTAVLTKKKAALQLLIHPDRLSVLKVHADVRELLEELAYEINARYVEWQGYFMRGIPYLPSQSSRLQEGSVDADMVDAEVGQDDADISVSGNVIEVWVALHAADRLGLLSPSQKQILAEGTDRYSETLSRYFAKYHTVRVAQSNAVVKQYTMMAERLLTRTEQAHAALDKAQETYRTLGEGLAKLNASAQTQLQSGGVTENTAETDHAKTGTVLYTTTEPSKAAAQHTETTHKAQSAASASNSNSPAANRSSYNAIHSLFATTATPTSVAAVSAPAVTTAAAVAAADMKRMPASKAAPSSTIATPLPSKPEAAVQPTAVVVKSALAAQQPERNAPKAAVIIKSAAKANQAKAAQKATNAKATASTVRALTTMGVSYSSASWFSGASAVTAVIAKHNRLMVDATERDRAASDKAASACRNATASA